MPGRRVIAGGEGFIDADAALIGIFLADVAGLAAHDPGLVLHPDALRCLVLAMGPRVGLLCARDGQRPRGGKCLVLNDFVLQLRNRPALIDSGGRELAQRFARRLRDGPFSIGIVDDGAVRLHALADQLGRPLVRDLLGLLQHGLPQDRILLLSQPESQQNLPRGAAGESFKVRTDCRDQVFPVQLDVEQAPNFIRMYRRFAFAAGRPCWLCGLLQIGMIKTVARLAGGALARIERCGNLFGFAPEVGR